MSQLHTLRKLTSFAVMLMCLYILSHSPSYRQWQQYSGEKLESGRMKNVTASTAQGQPLFPPAAGADSPLPLPEVRPVLVAAMSQKESSPLKTKALVSPEEAKLRDESIRETTIEGGLSIKNRTSYPVDMGKLLMEPVPVKLSGEGMQVLVIHTHASEAYTPAGLDLYEASDDCRTEDTKYNIVRVGDELCAVLEQAGLRVLHDRNIYDYPSYTGSYNRSGDAVQGWLAEYPEISVVIDMHRDALGENGTVYKTMAEEEGVCASQIMLLAGTDESGLSHPLWQQNLSLALYLQRTVSAAHPTLMRPVELVPQRYNQHLCTGSLILEVGSSGNTLQEALAAIRLFGKAAAPALLSLVSQEG